MPRSTRIYTRTGDDGTTGLTGGERVSKDALRVELYGTVDELNAVVGAAIATDLDAFLRKPLARIQDELFHLGAELSAPGEENEASPVLRMGSRHVKSLEAVMDRLSEELAPLGSFILPGGSPGAAQLHLARTVCRRAERLAVRLSHQEHVGQAALAFLNRLSDALFVMARYENMKRGVEDVVWDGRE